MSAPSLAQSSRGLRAMMDSVYAGGRSASSSVSDAVRNAVNMEIDMAGGGGIGSGGGARNRQFVKAVRGRFGTAMVGQTQLIGTTPSQPADINRQVTGALPYTGPLGGTASDPAPYPIHDLGTAKSVIPLGWGFTAPKWMDAAAARDSHEVRTDIATDLAGVPGSQVARVIPLGQVTGGAGHNGDPNDSGNPNNGFQLRLSGVLVGVNTNPTGNFPACTDLALVPPDWRSTDPTNADSKKMPVYRRDGHSIVGAQFELMPVAIHPDPTSRLDMFGQEGLVPLSLGFVGSTYVKDAYDPEKAAELFIAAASVSTGDYYNPLVQSVGLRAYVYHMVVCAAYGFVQAYPLDPACRELTLAFRAMVASAAFVGGTRAISLSEFVTEAKIRLGRVKTIMAAMNPSAESWRMIKTCMLRMVPNSVHTSSTLIKRCVSNMLTFSRNCVFGTTLSYSKSTQQLELIKR